jgi:inosine/xanthosine triphosphate pyrophosphatase family protein
VNDILIFGNNINMIKEVKDFLSSNFEIEDLDEADVILNIKLLREENSGVTLMQSHYVENVLNHFGHSDGTPAPTLYDPSVLLRKKIKE